MKNRVLSDTDFREMKIRRNQKEEGSNEPDFFNKKLTLKLTPWTADTWQKSGSGRPEIICYISHILAFTRWASLNLPQGTPVFTGFKRTYENILDYALHSPCQPRQYRTKKRLSTAADSLFYIYKKIRKSNVLRSGYTSIECNCNKSYMFLSGNCHRHP